MKNVAKQLLPIVLLIIAGCATTSTTYPILSVVNESDGDLSCRLLDEDIVDANILRDEIIEEHGDAISGAITDTAVQAVMNPVSAIMSGVMNSVSVSQATKHYTEAAAAAGSRMEQLLIYKREKDCLSGGNADPSLTDDKIVGLLEDALYEFQDGQIDEKEYVKRRVELLDDVR